jgi:putative endopeptidase
MDEDGIEAKRLTPLADEMARISAITNKASLSAYLGTTLNTEVDALTANADHVFGVWVNQSFEDSVHYVFHLLQGGLGTRDGDDYIDPSPKMSALRAQYQGHIAAILKLADLADSETRAARIMPLEVRIAQAHAPDADAADVFKQNNPWNAPTSASRAPGMDWGAYFTAAGIAGQPEFIVWQPSAVTGTSALVGSEDIDRWKDYLRFHLIEHYASLLPKAVAAEDFTFYGTILTGTRQAPERSKAAIAATNGALGQAVGQLYTQRYFPPEAKARAQAMVDDLITAYGARISNLTWMSPQTKEKALAKLAALRIGIGLSRLMDRLFDARRCARRRLRQYGPGGSLQPFVQSGQAKTTSRCGRVEDRSANRRRSHRVQPQYGNFLGWHPAAALFRLPRRCRV